MCRAFFTELFRQGHTKNREAEWPHGFMLSGYWRVLVLSMSEFASWDYQPCSQMLGLLGRSSRPS